MKNGERLDKIVANMGYGSRKDVKKHIKNGRVKVNNEIIRNNELKINPEKDIIHFDDIQVNYRKFIYLMMNKPQGLVSSTDDSRSKTVVDIIDNKYKVFKPFPVGRLDKDTEGLLIISNDGKMAHELLSPRKKVNKKYYVEVDNYIEDEHINIFSEGITLDDGYKTLPSQLEVVNSSIISRVYLTIQEGKFHQVKRMFDTIGMKVIYLKRVSMGDLNLDKTLEPGEYRELTEYEINVLRNS
ncbi:MAG: rRNA pseudouridine synthase [Tissierellaceae bacterium]|nr:rRNA pseudouridine synthase [Tissierellaceae bacterium]